MLSVVEPNKNIQKLITSLNAFYLFKVIKSIVFKLHIFFYSHFSFINFNKFNQGSLKNILLTLLVVFFDVIDFID